MGQAWSNKKFKSNEQYRKQILNLYGCAERLEGVSVYQIDGIEFFRRHMFMDANNPIDQVPSEFTIMNEWINNPHVMMCCDPSYISAEDEQKKLEGIDWEKEKSLSDALKREGKALPKNLGKIYTKSFDYEAQENFVRCIQNARCKILVSNYDLILYNKYLNHSTGWKRCEYLTTTSVGSKRDNKRTEVLWYNY